MMSSNSKTAALHPLKPVEFLVLAVLQEAPMHGYGMVLEMEQRSRGRVKVRPGDLYRVLYRLTQRSLIESADGPGQGSGDERRNYYRITTLGREVLRQEASFLHRVAGQVMAAGPAGEGSR